MDFVTTTCRDHDHPEFVLEVDPDRVPTVYAEDLCQSIEAMVAEGAVFGAGETFQIGWMVTQVHALDAERFTLHEPDMESLPLRYVPGVTETLRHKMIQVFTLDSYDVHREQLEISTIRHSAIVCDQVRTAETLTLERRRAENDVDSGWVFCCNHPDHDHEAEGKVRLTSLYEAMLLRPEIVSWMFFPTGSCIKLRPGLPPEVCRDDQALSLVSGSYVDQLLKRFATSPP